MDTARTTRLIEEAENLLRVALEEFEKGVKEGSDEAIRDSAEKAWRAVAKAADALLLAKGFSEENIETHRQKRLALEELAAKDPEVARQGFKDRFMAREYTLHVRCFYDGEYTLSSLREELEKARQFVEDVKKATA
ncbi:PaREP1 family protein [Thermofilum pendens]|uniref:HEPN domain-containing protein n=1 Tax=Thermofilum pendens (strain DSM 2475 / Hrk 5) TaxID=368408 RepID=A1RZV2_THEPD|nr:PaREP1 family protein [Thermofilum pendens]ABL78732.1 hypothetical protein Tpen_1335 [Thermofilum pendens Hrk 5]